MKNYIGVKIVKAEPMTKGAFEKRKGSLSPVLETDTTDGYMVKYPDGYISWCPKSEFEKAYRALDNEDMNLINSND
jgi:hypothetical protein|uniref:Dec protein, OB-Fold, Decoration, VIRAL PROTEIN n=1 Tax=Myoviridae sp. ct5xZ3 TaxID=2827601 RepID=A0A8S5RS10_9CAUD|nr:MAG TPA: Dec protein, OB-Fold, Decoration, VIRAL PROTEIN [Myoviridae sp. ct5xZ3]